MATDINANVKACQRCFKQAGKVWPSGVVVRCHVSGLPLFTEHVQTGDCPHAKFTFRGLGDAVAWGAHVTGLDNLVPVGCGGCGERRELLNKLAPARGN